MWLQNFLKTRCWVIPADAARQGAKARTHASVSDSLRGFALPRGPVRNALRFLAPEALHAAASVQPRSANARCAVHGGGWRPGLVFGSGLRDVSARVPSAREKRPEGCKYQYAPFCRRRPVVLNDV